MEWLSKDIHTWQLLEEMEANTVKHFAKIRGVWQVETDGKGKQRLHETLAEVDKLYQYLVQIIARLEWDNLALNQRLNYQAGLEAENRLLKAALRTKINIDNLGAEVKDAILKSREARL